jgi:hypothetical protein
MWVRDELLERIVPTIRDLKAKRRDRVDAILGWGSAGYVLRADALIELLHVREGGLKAEAIGSLDAVSGMPSGDEPDRWRAWCEGLPAGLTEMCEERTGALRL